MTKKQHYMTEPERYQLEGMLRAGKPVAWIARELGFCRQTIYNEIRRGLYRHDCGWYDELRYSAARSQRSHRLAQSLKGRPLKIGRDIAYADFLEAKILEEHFSPAAALAAARAAGHQTRICVSTLYRYIDASIFFRLSNRDLPEKKARKEQERKASRVVHPHLPSIEQRPAHIGRREEIGHWEMDLVVGKAETKPVLLTLTERLSRLELIYLLPDRRALSVRKIFNRLERENPNFREIFKSITTDNGSEFLEYEKLCRSIHGGKRFEVYYCHSYAAWEKGTNENHNRMIRRFIPKGTDLSNYTKEDIQALQDWMNHYPRKCLGWKTPWALAEEKAPAAAKAVRRGPQIISSVFSDSSATDGTDGPPRPC